MCYDKLMYSQPWVFVREEMRRGVDPAALADMGYPVEADGTVVPVDPDQTLAIVSLLNTPADTESDTWQIDPSARAVGLQAIGEIRQQLQSRKAS
jgi:hypothetical protein